MGKFHLDGLLNKLLDDRVNTSKSCSAYTTCDECLQAGVMCHYCAYDYQCHAIGSPNGCLIGMQTCHKIEECERTVPEHVGYGLSIPGYIIVFGIAALLICIFFFFGLLRGIYMKHKKMKRLQYVEKHLDQQNVALIPNKRRQQYEQRQERTFSRRNDDNVPDEEDEESLLETSSPDFMYADFVPDSERKRRSKNEIKRYRWAMIKRIIVLCTFLLALTIGILFFPRIPVYNVCNRELDWEAIFQNLRSLHPAVQYKVLGSVVNKNRFGFIMESGRAEIYHNSSIIGTWKLKKNWMVEPGSITDLLTVIEVEPNMIDAYNMWKDFEENKLYFNINAQIKGHLMLGSWKFYAVNQAVEGIEFRVGAQYDRSLCKCPNYG